MPLDPGSENGVMTEPLLGQDRKPVGADAVGAGGALDAADAEVLGGVGAGEDATGVELVVEGLTTEEPTGELEAEELLGAKGVTTVLAAKACLGGRTRRS